VHHDFTHMLKLGRHYMASWPLRKELAPMFPEYRVITATRLGLVTMPALAVLTVLLQWQFGLQFYWPTAVTLALFFASLPMQGLYWLGKRSDTPLPPGLRHWLQELRQKMALNGCILAPVPAHPTYQQLADNLDQAYRKMDKAFVRQML